MSDYHILRAHIKQHKAAVAFHIPVTGDTNFGGKTFQQAISEELKKDSETGTIESHYPLISNPENADLQNGEIYEHYEIVEFDANLTRAQKNQIIRDRHTVLVSIIDDKIRKEFDFWGYDSNP